MSDNYVIGGGGPLNSLQQYPAILSQEYDAEWGSKLARDPAQARAGETASNNPAASAAARDALWDEMMRSVFSADDHGERSPSDYMLGAAGILTPASRESGRPARFRGLGL